MAETKRLTASEKESLLRLNLALDILRLDMEPLRERIKLVRWAKRDIALLAAVAERLEVAFLETIPVEQLLMFRRTLQMTGYTIGAKRPGPSTLNTKEYGMWISYDVLFALLTGCHDHCLMCSDDPAQRRGCKLRKALETIPNDSKEREDGDCPFYTVL